MKEYNKENIPRAKTLRTEKLEGMDLTVLRICNLDIDRNFSDVCEYIDSAVKNLSLSQLR